VQAAPAREPELEPAEEIEEAAEPVVEMRRHDDSELEPTFEGEPIEDSLGWVTTAAQEDMALEDEVEAALIPEWVDEAEEWEELPKPAAKKKKGKKAGKGRWTESTEEQWQYGGLGRLPKSKPTPPPRRR
jgi:hypothetical protein